MEIIIQSVQNRMIWCKTCIRRALLSLSHIDSITYRHQNDDCNVQSAFTFVFTMPLSPLLLLSLLSASCFICSIELWMRNQKSNNNNKQMHGKTMHDRIIFKSNLFAMLVKTNGFSRSLGVCTASRFAGRRR